MHDPASVRLQDAWILCDLRMRSVLQMEFETTVAMWFCRTMMLFLGSRAVCVPPLLAARRIHRRCWRRIKNQFSGRTTYPKCSFKIFVVFLSSFLPLSFFPSSSSSSFTTSTTFVNLLPSVYNCTEQTAKFRVGLLFVRRVRRQSAAQPRDPRKV